MAPIPLIGPSKLTEYLSLTLSFTLLFLENIVRSITLLLPTPIIRFCYRSSRTLFNALSSPLSRKARNKKKSVSSPIAHAQDFVELCNLFGYYAEEHIVQTGDGYLLGLHRLGWKKGEEDVPVNAGPHTTQKKVVYLHHGLLMNSEVWVCLTEAQRCLPFVLVEQGYDVWLGNNRGNKYSKKSLHHSPTDTAFWNFSMDQFAFHDIPDSIAYILSTTSQASLSYIGFSQGTAQAFATLSIHPTLNAKIDVFVALAPAMAPPGLASGIVASLVKSNPSILFLAFGRRAILGSATMWQALLYPALFAWFIDKCLLYLFNWRTHNITPHQKLAAYPHLYSFTSTKSVVHWFQIIRHGTFQMYDDDEVMTATNPFALLGGNGSQYYKVAKFPTRNIKTPIVLVYGGSDSLVDIERMLKELPRHTVARKIQKYEHLDLLWAADVDELVFPHVLEALEQYGSTPEKARVAGVGWRRTGRRTLDGAAWGSQGSTAASLRSGYEEDEAVGAPARSAHTMAGRAMNGTSGSGLGGNVAGFDFGLGDRPSTAEEGLDESDDDEEDEHDGIPQQHILASASARYDSPTPSRRHAGIASPPPRTISTRAVRSPSLASESTVRQEHQPHHQRGGEGSGSGSGSPWSAKHRALLSPSRLRAEKRVSILSASDDTATAPPLDSPTLSNGTGSVGRHPRPEGWWSSGGDEESGEEEKENRDSGGGGLPFAAGAKAGAKVGRGGSEVVAGAGFGGPSSGGGPGARKRRRDAEIERG
ncbi:cholesterol esterase [Friedmanniomyces endolithicus]|uniref:Cholesterol esterase n=1 Tax=Friedmanniomyces endolithicus TaxID=329885 RepID=A0AAN6FK03_9PEZI|nr:cholesterol esterase [Friedmanniomyces endolithicus]KAK0294984.1 cholesterol esterase [Friedmanniomyces endolithicus]KAK0319838.1 cholesterol esterase [Friedmanniomyces endolithicus]KAK0990636.1 cholesterol esterase [Friedmanniomyces endolithicus]